MTRLLIGIPTFRRPVLLRRLLGSLARQAGLSAIDVDILVADNDFDGREGVQAVEGLVADFPLPLRAKAIAGIGISHVRNALLDAARQGGFDYLAMLDDDEWAEPGWLGALMERARRDVADVVAGPVRYAMPADTPQQVRESGIFWNPDRSSGPVPIVTGTGNVLLSCAALERAGWPQFDAGFGLTGGGDHEYFTRLSGMGFRFSWCEEAIAHEDVPAERATAKWVLRRAYRYGNGAARIAVRHHGGWAVARLAGTALLKLAASPVYAPLLLLPANRLRTQVKLARALGNIGGLVGLNYHEYARRHAVPADETPVHAS